MGTKGTIEVLQAADLKAIKFHDINIIDYTADLNTEISIALVKVPIGAKHSKAFSERSDKYYFIKKGTILFTRADKKHMLMENDMIIIEKGQHFEYMGITETEMLLIHYPFYEIAYEKFVK